MRETPNDPSTLVVAALMLGLLYAATYVVEGIVTGSGARPMKRPFLRWQRFLFRKRFPLGDGPAKGTALVAGAFITIMRVILALFAIVLFFAALRWTA